MLIDKRLWTGWVVAVLASSPAMADSVSALGEAEGTASTRPAVGERYSFVVLGGSGTASVPQAGSRELLQARDEINFLRPALVVQVGGGVMATAGGDIEALAGRWDAYEDIRRSFVADCFHVVGATSVVDGPSQQIGRAHV